MLSSRTARLGKRSRQIGHFTGEIRDGVDTAAVSIAVLAQA